MSIKIGHASKDERSKIKGGSAGDQTGFEVCVRDWYNRPWNVVLRCTDSKMAEKIAVAMEKACKNDKIGYDQNQRNTLLTQARKVNYDLSKVTSACETDCTALGAVCCISAGIPESALYKDSNLAYSGNIKSRLVATGKFTAYTASKYLTSDKYLKRGDILLYEGHHLAIALEDGSEMKPKVTTPTASASTSSAVKIDTAKSFNKKYARTYTTTANLHLRAGAGKTKKSLLVMPKGAKVTNYGYFTDNAGAIWLLVKYDKYTGFCSKTYLK